jgi:hypothetical protein
MVVPAAPKELQDAGQKVVTALKKLTAVASRIPTPPAPKSLKALQTDLGAVNKTIKDLQLRQAYGTKLNPAQQATLRQAITAKAAIEAAIGRL